MLASYNELKMLVEYIESGADISLRSVFPQSSSQPFSSSGTVRFGRAQLEKECKSISDDLMRRGFSRKNIYACDLRKAIDGGVAMKELFGLPSYDIFKHQCINEMIESGISRKYTAIYNAWEEYFKKNPITVSSEDSAISGKSDLMLSMASPHFSFLAGIGQNI